MKNLLLSTLLFTISTIAFAQENDSVSNENTVASFDEDENMGRNEVSINAFNLVAFGIIDLSYERIISENSTWSVEGFYHGKDEEIDEAYYKKLSLTGKYKHFFSSTYARGFYVHGFGMLSNGDYNYDYYYDVNDYRMSSDSYTDFAIGFGLGGKFVSSGGFLLDLSGGIGRNLFNSNSPEIIGQFMVNLGYRF